MHRYKKFYALLTSANRRQLPVILLLIIIGMLLEMLGIGLIIPVLSLMSDGGGLENNSKLQTILNYFTFSSPAHLLAFSMLILTGIYFIKSVFTIFMLWKENKFIFELHADLSSRLFEKYLFQPWSFYLQRNSAQLINNVVTEVNVFTYDALQSVMVLITDGIVLLGIFVLLFLVRPIGTLIVIFSLGSTAWILPRLTKNYLLQNGIKHQYHEGMRIQHLQQGLGAVKEVKLLGKEHAFIEKYNLHNKAASMAVRSQKTLVAMPRLWLELLAISGLTILVLVLLKEQMEITALLPTLGFFTAAAFRILPSVNRMLVAHQNLKYSQPVISRLYNELQMTNEINEPQYITKMPFVKELRIEHISFQYPGSKQQILKNISFVIPYGKSVGFIGKSGAGKTTLFDIILGLLPPSAGRVLVDGIDIRNNLRGWQAQIGYVPQSIFLTDETLLQNIAFGVPEDKIDNQAVKNAIKLAQLEEFVSNLPRGIETVIGERGVRLSGGQRQKIGIARALYHNPSVLLFDEAVNALDVATEKSVMETIYSLRGDKTILIISHRETSVDHCDLIYKIENGYVFDNQNRDTSAFDDI